MTKVFFKKANFVHTYLIEIDVWFVLATDAVIDNLQAGSAALSEASGEALHEGETTFRCTKHVSTASKREMVRHSQPACTASQR